jgi:hypothetical protein
MTATAVSISETLTAHIISSSEKPLALVDAI